MCCRAHVEVELITLCSMLFFFMQKTAYEMRISDWSSDVCSSDLHAAARAARAVHDTGDAGPGHRHDGAHGPRFRHDASHDGRPGRSREAGGDWKSVV